ncbi:RadC family protein [Vagococcus elongatus]|uniref:MPN domain-containing protein n=1 Tax=Vagococcus elongatus TaxID=180344 RepID=A0A430ARN7_9ENTE|nr:DNA repair protein RadC [Vagococcus elongatus]RSU10721.1 hypothetical protein CBF29_09050 [Vagococcus elongatus]
MERVKERTALIREMPLSSLPRERLLLYGGSALSEQELLAIVLRTGSQGKNVMRLASEVLHHFESLYDLKKASLEELQAISGIGKVKSIELAAMFELGTRIAQANQIKLGQVVSSSSLGQMMIDELKDLQQEHLVGIYLNTKNEMIKKEVLFIGSLNQSIAHPREIYRSAVKYAAARFILVHNHPSGNPKMSQNDIDFTKRIVECGELIGIELLDHLIVGHDSYISLREEGIV